MLIIKPSGFNLIELMVTVAIVGILAAVALPSYQSSVRKSNRSDGKATLLEANSRMERYFYTNNTYTTNLTQLGYSAASNAPSAEGHYTLTVMAATTACPIATCYQLQATAIGTQVPDGDLTINSLGQKTPNSKW